MLIRRSPLLAVLALVPAVASAQGLVTEKILSLGLARTIAEAALSECKSKGFATSVAVVDRAGQVLVLAQTLTAGPAGLRLQWPANGDSICGI